MKDTYKIDVFLIIKKSEKVTDSLYKLQFSNFILFS